ncbi:hypothetical protein QY049_03265 [Bradyrhizobium sp. WYCCWR 13022]|uniref:hypothetical protein n=1 Tax=unclassified Bradyrhizobium TaxID=2631580 RepID=UPI00263A4716|nr:hypothetical protein [Bradyrhizobium sp. WYCCWR 13022]MDN4982245.1 hypothetical protein [Bradyrhizobium sp. WYCCWR 13022]
MKLGKFEIEVTANVRETLWADAVSRAEEQMTIFERQTRELEAIVDELMALRNAERGE